MDILARIITFVIIATALFFGFYFLMALRKEGGGRIKKGIEICCSRKIKRLEIEKNEIEETRNFYPIGSFGYERGILAMAIWDLKIAICESLINK